MMTTPAKKWVPVTYTVFLSHHEWIVYTATLTGEVSAIRYLAIGWSQ